MPQRRASNEYKAAVDPQLQDFSRPGRKETSRPSKRPCEGCGKGKHDKRMRFCRVCKELMRTGKMKVPSLRPPGADAPERNTK